MNPIDSIDLLDELEELKSMYARCAMPAHAHALGEAIKVIKRQPTLRTKPLLQNGRWSKGRYSSKTYIRICSACGGEAYFCGTGCSYAYCPNCGASMIIGRQK